MNHMCRLQVMLTPISLLIAAANAHAIKCPDSFAEMEDWDRDGILNKDDNCCFTATFLEHNEPSFCSEDDKADVNMNGIPQSEEGECCITEDGVCGGAETELCKQAGDEKTAVRCDNLLVYSGLWMPSANVVESCEDFCVCFTVEDFDDDFFQTTDTFVSGSLDNCPNDDNPPSENSGQSNSDSDIFGDACDSCPELYDEPIPCEIGSLQKVCPPYSECVPFVLQIENRIAVKQYCSMPLLQDENGDGLDDRCNGADDSDTGGDVDTDTDSDTHGQSETDPRCDAGFGCDTFGDDASVVEDSDTETDDSDSVLDTESKPDAGLLDTDTDSDTESTSDNDTEDKETEEKDTDSVDSGGDTETEGTDTDTEKDTDIGETDSLGSDTEDSETATVIDSDTEDKDKLEDTDGIREDVYLGGALSCDCRAASTTERFNLFELIRALL